MHWALIAYSKVATKRFTDAVPMTLRLYFLEKSLADIISLLRSVSDEELETILAENSTVVKARNAKLEELQALKRSRKLIESM